MLNRELAQGAPGGWTHVMWVDADAVVVDLAQGVEALIAEAGSRAELIIGESLVARSERSAFCVCL